MNRRLPMLLVMAIATVPAPQTRGALDRGIAVAPTPAGFPRLTLGAHPGTGWHREDFIRPSQDTHFLAMQMQHILAQDARDLPGHGKPQQLGGWATHPMEPAWRLGSTSLRFMTATNTNVVRRAAPTSQPGPTAAAAGNKPRP